ncbi:MAG: resolvase [Phormidesmis priestleyi]|uniref:Resolvase n=1 Tax=Phormidesmis priestleyi TaxID=268141 RepID=A0A2W4WWX8_9CYAN|nr:MAG: resolvase [Phormidesmis priestleyi]
MGPAILGFDPGRAKCGLAVVGLDRSLYYHQVVPVNEVTDIIHQLRETYPISSIVLGDQTGSKQWQSLLSALPNPPRITLVDERYSSLEARDRYWQMYPAKGLDKLIPQGMRNIPRPIDDIVAILLVERYLKRLSGED